MEIRIDRKWKKSGYTISRLFINGERFGDGKHYCSVLEDQDRGLRSDMPLAEIANMKIYGQTAIPTGRYKVTISWSPTFRKRLPLLNDVPGYSGIRIHSGNNPKDTMGCLLPGYNDKVGWVSNSRYWFNLLFARIKKAIDAGEEVYITVG